MKRWLLLPLVLIITCGYYFKDSIDSLENISLEIGDTVDSLNGVKVYYNGSVSNVSGRNLTADGYNLGLKYQCVEFVKRYYYEHYNHKMPDSYGHAKDFFEASLNDGEKSTRRNLVQFHNPSGSKPKIGDLVVMDANSFNPYGHVAIVSQIHHNKIEIIQQNPGPTASSRITIALERTDGKWHLKQSDILGWLRKP